MKNTVQVDLSALPLTSKCSSSPTDTLSMDRDAMNELIESKGGKAEKLGVPVIDKEGLRNLLV